MGKRKVNRSETSETLNRKGERDDDEGEEGEKGFFACYLLTSLCPRYKGHTYIGFTVNPRRRIRQHNGEIRCGAWRTKTKRPWEMVLCIYGFPTNVAALQFEWAWQHPVESLAVRKAAVAFKSLSGVANKVKLAYTMLNLPAWQSLNLTVNFFSTKYTKHYAGCPSLPDHMRVQVCSMYELPCYTGYDQNTFENDLWDDDEELITGGSSKSAEEGLEDALPVHDSSADNQNNIREATPEQNNRCCAEDYCPTQPRNDSPTQKEDQGQPFCVRNSPERVIPSFSTTNSCSGVSPLSDWPTRENLTSNMDADKDEPPIKIPAFPSEVEVIDVFTPSPDYRISSRRKKRGISTGCPQIIDLTQSPIFV